MKVAIIILNYNDYKVTKKYVEKIKDYNILNKILIVDNKSPKYDFVKLKEIEFGKVKVIQTDKNGGYAYGNNFGLKSLEKDQYDYVIISNPDISVEEDAILKCIDELEKNKNIAIIAPRMYIKDKPARRSAWKERTYLRDIANTTRLTEALLYPIFKSGEYSKKDFENEKLKVDCIAGSFFIARYSYFKEVGYFDENTFLFYEEDILGKKMKLKGYEIYSLNDIKFDHFDSQTIGKIYNEVKKRKILKNSQKYYHKTYNNIGKLRLLIFDILFFIKRIEIPFEKIIRKIIKK